MSETTPKEIATKTVPVIIEGGVTFKGAHIPKDKTITVTAAQEVVLKKHGVI